jgi:hypothetical protein
MSRRFLATILCSAAALLLLSQVGCATPTRSGQENLYRYERFAGWESTMLAEDVERFWMMGRETRLTRWKFR